jgi:hypothetical protein
MWHSDIRITMNIYGGAATADIRDARKKKFVVLALQSA